MLPPDCSPLPEALYHPQLEGCGRLLLGGVRGLSLKTLQHPKQQEMIRASGIRAPISAHQSEFHVSVMGCCRGAGVLCKSQICIFLTL